MDSQFSLRWNNYTNLITQAFGSLLHEEDLVDVTLSCEGKKIKAHKMLLSACSPYFHDIFKDNPCQHPVIVFQNVQFADLKAIVEFIYRGEVNVLQEQFESFLSTAEMMEVKGLTDKDSESEIVETSGITRDQENVLIGPVREQRISSQSTKLVSFVHEKSGPRSPPAKRKKPNAKKSSDESSTSSQVVTVVKEEVEDISIVDERDVSFSESEVSELLAPVKPGLKPSNQESLPVPETLQDNGEIDPSSCLSLRICENVKTTKLKDHRIRETENSKYRLTKFRRSWMLESRFASWLQECESNPYSAFCRVCPKIVCLSNMGTRALTSHMNGKRHQEAVLMVTSDQMVMGGK